MNPAQAIASVLRQYATFSGRARRSEYWWWALASGAAITLAGLMDRALGTTLADSTAGSVGWVAVAVWLVLLVPSLAVLFRRLHDTGRSGWWWLMSLLCLVGAMVVLIFCLLDSEPGSNEYGPSPKET